MAQAVKMPWGALRPAKEPFLSHPGAVLVEVDEGGRILGPVKKKRAARKKAAPPPPVDNLDLGDLDGLDDI